MMSTTRNKSTLIPISRILIFLQLTAYPFNVLSSVEIGTVSVVTKDGPIPPEVSQWDSFKSGAITVRFSPPRLIQTTNSEGVPDGKMRFDLNIGDGGMDECRQECECDENGGFDERLQAHVEREIGKMMAGSGDQLLPESFKVHLPPDMMNVLSGPEESTTASAADECNTQLELGSNTPSDATTTTDTRREKTYEIPASGLNEAIVRGYDGRGDSDKWTIHAQDDDTHTDNDGTFNQANEREADTDTDEQVKFNANNKNGKGRESPVEINHDDILKALDWKSYAETTTCSVAEGKTLLSIIKDMIPFTFQRYNCLQIVRELAHHQVTSMWSERAVLEEFFFSIIGICQDQITNINSWKYHPLVQYDTWLSNLHHCHWGGVSCGYTTIGVGAGASVENTFDTESTSSEECKKSRQRSRHKNRCDGKRYLDGWTCLPCPPNDGVTKLDLTMLNFPGVLPDNLYMLRHLHRLNVMGNFLKGGIPSTFQRFERLEFLDVSKNELSGPLPDRLPVSLTELWLEENRFTGTIPESIITMTSMYYFDASHNSLEGTIPNLLGNMTWLNSLYLSQNHFTGTIPEFQPTIHLRLLDLSGNSLEGTLPLSVSQSLYALEHLDLSSNHLTGTVPEFPHHNNHVLLNLTANEFTGKIPPSLCQGGPYSSTFGCDAVMCKQGQFSPVGHASHLGPCVDCPDEEPFLGQTTCSSESNYLVGDINLDGVLSEREVLNLFFILADGFEWGTKYSEWQDLEASPCELPGITCEENQVTHINLTDAQMCTNHLKYSNGCTGLPSEIGLLTNLKSLEIKGGTAKLKGTIPSEIASLKNLETLILEGSALKGSITDIARLESLRFLNLSNCGISGKLPPFGPLNSKLRVLNLALNSFEGTIPSSYGHIANLEELILSRNKLSGTIIDFSRLKKLDNLELYGNALRGSIPNSLGSCSGLKRVDLFSNMLTGTIPSEFGNIQTLQILHLKANYLSGTLPPSLMDEAPNFLWLDVSGNQIIGTIPPSYGKSKSLKDLRLGGNQIYGPLADELCKNRDLNDAAAGDKFGCDHILCPLGTISEAGYATASSGCVPCPEDQSTLYLGSDSCHKFTQKEILRMLYLLLDGQSQTNEDPGDWASDQPECEWKGVTCDDGGEVVGLAFTNSGLKL